jgi:hypothetical protein
MPKFIKHNLSYIMVHLKDINMRKSVGTAQYNTKETYRIRQNEVSTNSLALSTYGPLGEMRDVRIQLYLQFLTKALNS